MYNFTSIEEAYKWMGEKVNSRRITNRRYCFLNVGEQVAEFWDMTGRGGNTQFETDVTINGLPARIGCDYLP